MTDVVNIGAAANDGTGDHLRIGFSEINAKLAELESAATTRKPAAPTLMVTPGDGQAQIWWVDGDQGSSPITEHILYVSTTPGANTIAATITTSVEPYILTGLTDGQIYYFRLSAVNGSGEGDKSAELNATPYSAGNVSAPAPPSISVTAGNGFNAIAFTDGDNGGSPVTLHKLYRAESSGDEVYLVDVMTGSPYTDSAVINGHTYYYFLTSINAVGESSFSNEDSGEPAGQAQLAITNNPQSFPATVNRAYSFSFVVTGGAGGGGFVLNGGTLPTGLTFNNTNGSITGTPTVSAVVSGLSVTYTDSTGASVTSKSFTFSVNPVMALGPAAPLVNSGQSSQIQITGLNADGETVTGTNVGTVGSDNTSIIVSATSTTSVTVTSSEGRTLNMTVTPWITPTLSQTFAQATANLGQLEDRKFGTSAAVTGTGPGEIAITSINQAAQYYRTGPSGEFSSTGAVLGGSGYGTDNTGEMAESGLPLATSDVFAMDSDGLRMFSKILAGTFHTTYGQIYHTSGAASDNFTSAVAAGDTVVHHKYKVLAKQLLQISDGANSEMVYAAADSVGSGTSYTTTLKAPVQFAHAAATTSTGAPNIYACVMRNAKSVNIYTPIQNIGLTPDDLTNGNVKMYQCVGLGPGFSYIADIDIPNQAILFKGLTSGGEKIGYTGNYIVPFTNYFFTPLDPSVTVTPTNTTSVQLAVPLPASVPEGASPVPMKLGGTGYSSYVSDFRAAIASGGVSSDRKTIGLTGFRVYNANLVGANGDGIMWVPYVRTAKLYDRGNRGPNIRNRVGWAQRMEFCSNAEPQITVPATNRDGYLAWRAANTDSNGNVQIPTFGSWFSWWWYPHRTLANDGTGVDKSLNPKSIGVEIDNETNFAMGRGPRTITMNNHYSATNYTSTVAPGTTWETQAGASPSTPAPAFTCNLTPNSSGLKGVSIFDGNWHSLAIVWDGFGIMRYVDDVPVVYQTFTVDPLQVLCGQQTNLELTICGGWGNLFNTTGLFFPQVDTDITRRFIKFRRLQAWSGGLGGSI